MGIPRACFLILLVVSLFLAGCGESDSGQGVAETQPSVSTPAASDEQAAPRAATCVDKKGDGGTIDLVKASLSVGDAVVVSVELAGPIPQRDYAGVGVNVASADGNTFRVLGMQWVDGRARPYFSDMETGLDDLPPSALQVDGHTVTLTFRPSTVDDLEDGWTWGAFTSDGDTDQDACPGRVGSMPTKPY